MALVAVSNSIINIISNNSIISSSSIIAIIKVSNSIILVSSIMVNSIVKDMDHKEQGRTGINRRLNIRRVKIMDTRTEL